MTTMLVQQEHATVFTAKSDNRDTALAEAMQIAHEREQTKPVTVYELVEIYRTGSGKCST